MAQFVKSNRTEQAAAPFSEPDSSDQ